MKKALLFFVLAFVTMVACLCYYVYMFTSDLSDISAFKFLAVKLLFPAASATFLTIGLWFLFDQLSKKEKRKLENAGIRIAKLVHQDLAKNPNSGYAKAASVAERVLR